MISFTIIVFLIIIYQWLFFLGQPKLFSNNFVQIVVTQFSPFSTLNLNPSLSVSQHVQHGESEMCVLRDDAVGVEPPLDMRQMPPLGKRRRLRSHVSMRRVQTSHGGGVEVLLVSKKEGGQGRALQSAQVVSGANDGTRRSITVARFSERRSVSPSVAPPFSLGFRDGRRGVA